MICFLRKVGLRLCFTISQFSELVKAGLVFLGNLWKSCCGWIIPIRHRSLSFIERNIFSGIPQLFSLRRLFGWFSRILNFLNLILNFLMQWISVGLSLLIFEKSLLYYRDPHSYCLYIMKIFSAYLIFSETVKYFQNI